MTPAMILALAFGTLTLGVVAAAVLQQNRAHDLAILEAADARRSWEPRVVERGDAWLRTTSLGGRTAALLAGAGLVSWSPTLVVLGVPGLAALAGLAAFPVAGVVGSVLVAATVVAGFRKWLESRRQARIEKFIAQLPELARLLANGAQAGLGVRRSLDLAAAEMEEPAASELRQVSSEMAVGQDLGGALAHLSERLPSRELVVLVQTLVIQNRAGGALVTALTHIATTLEDRRQLRREVRTAVSGASFSGFIVILMGAGSVLLMNMLSPGALDEMIGSFVGRIALITAAALFGVGFLLIRRISAVDV